MARARIRTGCPAEGKAAPGRQDTASHRSLYGLPTDRREPKKEGGPKPAVYPTHPSNSEEVVAQRHVPVARQAVVRGLDVAHAGEFLAFGLVVLVGQVAHARAHLPAVLRRTIGRASCRERCVSTCRSRWAP